MSIPSSFRPTLVSAWPTSIRRIRRTLAASLKPPRSWTQSFPARSSISAWWRCQMNDFATAQPELEKAASLRPKDPKILTSLAYAQNGTHQFQNVLETAKRVHALDHKGMANVHYVAASAAMSLKDYDAMERELNFFLSEDPTNAFAPVARQNLAALAHDKAVRAARAASPAKTTTLVASLRPESFPNSERLKAQLNAAGDESDAEACEDCGMPGDTGPATEAGNSGAAANVPSSASIRSGWTIRTERRPGDHVFLRQPPWAHGERLAAIQHPDFG